MAVYVYWDATANDHVVEVKRLRGDGFRTSICELFNTIKRAVLGETWEVAAAPKGGFLSRRALPLPFSMPSSSSAHHVAGCMSEQEFLSGIQPIFSMARGVFLEGKLESAKMLCDLATTQRVYLELPQCVLQCTEALVLLLSEEDFDDVRQMAVVALSAFLELPAYRRAFAQSDALDTLASLVTNCPVQEEAFGCAAMRRAAAHCLVLLAQSAPGEVRSALGSLGYACVQCWTQHAGELRDERTRALAHQTASCFSMEGVGAK
jgi:hypothetical protein